MTESPQVTHYFIDPQTRVLQTEWGGRVIEIQEGYELLQRLREQASKENKSYWDLLTLQVVQVSIFRGSGG